MKKIHYCLSFLIILCITTCSLSALVFADEHSASGHQVWDGVPPYINPGSFNYSGTVDPDFAVNNGYRNYSFSGSPYGVYTHSQQEAGIYTYSYTNGLYWDFGRQPQVSADGFQTFSYSYQKVFNGETYTIYYVMVSPLSPVMSGAQVVKDGQYYTVSYDESFGGTQVFDVSLGNQSNCMSVINYFMFGEGDLDYELPPPEPEEIEDGDLDIHGLIGSVANTQYVEDSNTVGSAWKRFCNSLFALLPDAVSEFIGTPNFSTSLGSVKTTVPGVQLIWDSPDVSTIVNCDDPDAIQYTIWVDGRSSINIPFNHYNYVDTVTFNKLQLRSGPIVYHPTLTCYYNTNTNYQVLLDYFMSQVNLSQSAQSQVEGKAIFNTLFSRVYIQASQVDENGDIHRGAVSYVDFRTGSPVVYEGVTSSIDDIESSDSEDGTDNTVTQDYTVSGNTIVYGDTITNNNTTNNYIGGLVVGGGSFLEAGLSIIRAFLELVKMLFAMLLVPNIVLGWTGHF